MSANVHVSGKFSMRMRSVGVASTDPLVVQIEVGPGGFWHECVPCRCEAGMCFHNHDDQVHKHMLLRCECTHMCRPRHGTTRHDSPPCDHGHTSIASRHTAPSGVRSGGDPGRKYGRLV